MQRIEGLIFRSEKYARFAQGDDDSFLDLELGEEDSGRSYGTFNYIFLVDRRLAQLLDFNFVQNEVVGQFEQLMRTSTFRFACFGDLV